MKVSLRTSFEIDSVVRFGYTRERALDACEGAGNTLEIINAVYSLFAAYPPRRIDASLHDIVEALASVARIALRQASNHCAPKRHQSASCIDARHRTVQGLDAIFAFHTRPSLSLREVAKHVDVSESYLCGLLRTYSGKGFLTHLHAVRVLHAIVLLVDTRELIGAIAHHCGYLQTFQLDRQFQRRFHATPGEFRRPFDSVTGHRTEALHNFR